MEETRGRKKGITKLQIRAYVSEDVFNELGEYAVSELMTRNAVVSMLVKDWYAARQRAKKKRAKEFDEQLI